MDDLIALADELKGPLYKLLLSANSVDMELRDKVDDAFKALEAQIATLSDNGGQ